MTDFAAVSRSIIADFLRHHPVWATWSGLYDYDADLDDLTADGFAQAQARAHAHLAELKPFDPSRLDADDRIDHALLGAKLRAELRELTEREPHKHDPSLYSNVAVDGVYSLLARHPELGISKEVAALEQRLKKIPAALAAGQVNLESSPRMWTETAIEESEAAEGFLRDAISPIADRTTSLRSALADATAAFADYTRFLKDRHWPRDDRPFAASRDYFEFKLKIEHLLPFDADWVLQFGEDAVRATQAELDRTAATIDESRNWIVLVDALRTQHPAPETLLDEYRRGIEQARRFVSDRALVSVPEEVLKIVETPAFLRPTLPYAAYMPAAAFDASQPGLYYVTPVDPSAPEEVRRDTLLGHNRYAMLLTNVHEGYPGHHLQLVRCNHLESAPRRLLHDDVFCEGWALYCEQLVLDEGMTTDPRVRLFQLKDQLWRACRVVVDVKLHTAGMTFDDAVAMLVDVAHLEKANALAEVRRYTHSPTQPLSYLVGKHQILTLRAAQQARLKERFDLRQFHDRLLSYGSVPLALVQAELTA